MTTIEQAKQFLKDKGYILHLWHKDDVIHKAKELNIELNQWQINQIASLIEEKTNCSVGVNWDAIEAWIDYILQWTTTDPNCNQKGRQIDERTYEFQEERLSNPETGETYLYEAEIYLDSYTIAEMKDAMKAFGYDELQDNWIVAECLFELSED